MRTLAILLLAGINLALLTTVSLQLLRSADSPPAPVLVSEPAVPAIKEARILYVKEVPSQTSRKVISDNKDVKDVKDVVDAKDSVEPVAELLPDPPRILSGAPVPNSEFVSNRSSNPPSDSSISSTIHPAAGLTGILAPPRASNIAPPTVSGETPF